MSEWLATTLVATSLAMGVLWYLWESRAPKSRFRYREYERRTSVPHGNSKKTKSRKPPLLTGFTPSRDPYVVLGVPPHASKKEILTAHRNLMKQYHPDRVGRPGSQSWKDAQEIATAINQAKDTLLKRH